MLKVICLVALSCLVLFGCSDSSPTSLGMTQPAMHYASGGPVFNLAWSSDGRIASASHAGLKLWNPREASIPTLPGHHGYVWGVAWSPDQKHLASDGWDGLVNVWNSQTNELERAFSLEGLAFWSLAWSPDSTRLATGADKGIVKVYTPATGVEESFTTGDPSPVVSVAWSPQGDSVVVGDVTGNLTLWSTKTWEVVRTYAVESDRMRYDVNGAVWSPNGRWFATAHQDGWVRVWDPAQEKAIAGFQQQKGWIRAIAWNPDNRTLAAGGEDGSLSVWDFPANKVQLTFAESTLPFWSAAWSPDGTQLAAGTGVYSDPDQGGVLVWSATK